MRSKEGWSLIKEDKHWKSEQYPNEKTGTHNFRVTGIAEDIPILNLTPILYETDLLKTWMPLCKEAKECSQLSLWSKMGMIRVGLFWPIHDREAVLLGYGVEDFENGRMMVYFDSKLEDNEDFEVPKIGVCLFCALASMYFLPKKKKNIGRLQASRCSHRRILIRESNLEGYQNNSGF